MKANSLTLLALVLLFFLPPVIRAEVITIGKVTTEVKVVSGTEFKLFFKFDLPKFAGKVSIDYAELTLGLNVVEQNSQKFFEILSGTEAVAGKLGVYNSNPVTATVSSREKNLKVIELDITQLLDLWVNGGVANNGITLISHRRVAEKSLATGKVDFAPEFKAPTVRIFYTVQP